jgi:hypothetical protein
MKIVSSFLALTLCALLAGPTSSVFGQETATTPVSLFLSPNPSLSAEQYNAPQGWWAVINQGPATINFASTADSAFIVQMSAEKIARVQLGGKTLPKNELINYWGRPILASIEVRGEITALAAKGGLGAVLIVEVDGTGKNTAKFNLGPKVDFTERPGEPTVKPSLGKIEWTKLEGTFRLPYNTQKITYLAYLMNSAGSLEWRNPRLELAAKNATITCALPEELP